jgi:cytochrome c2
MSIFFMKSILSLVLLLTASAGMFTMFETFGRGDRRYNVETLRKFHKIAGIFYLLIFAVIAFFCLRFIFITKTELSLRAMFHGVFALAILVLLGVKILYIRVYKQFYNQAKVFGLLISLFTFGAVGTSAGYYLLVSEFGTDVSYDKIIQYKEKFVKEGRAEVRKPPVRTDPESIDRGKIIFEDKCKFCHSPYDTETIVGPGLKGILKHPELPVSGRPATPENIRRQFRQPFRRMPSFGHLSDEEEEDIIAFLNTL